MDTNIPNDQFSASTEVTPEVSTSHKRSRLPLGHEFRLEDLQDNQNISLLLASLMRRKSDFSQLELEGSCAVIGYTTESGPIVAEYLFNLKDIDDAYPHNNHFLLVTNRMFSDVKYVVRSQDKVRFINCPKGLFASAFISTSQLNALVADYDSALTSTFSKSDEFTEEVFDAIENARMGFTDIYQPFNVVKDIARTILLHTNKIIPVVIGPNTFMNGEKKSSLGLMLAYKQLKIKVNPSVRFFCNTKREDITALYSKAGFEITNQSI